MERKKPGRTSIEEGLMRSPTEMFVYGKGQTKDSETLAKEETTRGQRLLDELKQFQSELSSVTIAMEDLSVAQPGVKGYFQSVFADERMPHGRAKDVLNDSLTRINKSVSTIDYQKNIKGKLQEAADSYLQLGEFTNDLLKGSIQKLIDDILQQAEQLIKLLESHANLLHKEFKDQDLSEKLQASLSKIEAIQVKLTSGTYVPEINDSLKSKP